MKHVMSNWLHGVLTIVSIRQSFAFVPSLKLAQSSSLTPSRKGSSWVGSGRAVTRPARSLSETGSPSILDGTATAHGEVQFVAENGELAVEETVQIIYTPPKGMFEAAETLLYCGGFNGWDGEEEPVAMPMLPTDGGRYSVNINIPNFARVLDFTVTDGVLYDTGPDGAFFHALVTHVRDEDEAGNVILYRQEQDGTLIKTGMIPKVDPKELERMMEEATKNLPKEELEPVVDDTIRDVNENLKNEIIVTIDEQEAVQKMRAEASVLGERLGLGNMQVNEARDIFDMHDNEIGLLPFEQLGKVLAQLGFDEVDAKYQSELIGTHVLKERPDAESVTLTEFMHMFSALDKADVGIDIL